MGTATREIRGGTLMNLPVCGGDGIEPVKPALHGARPSPTRCSSRAPAFGCQPGVGFCSVSVGRGR